MTIGVLGAGQLGRMLALAGYPLGQQFRFFDPAAGAPAGQIAPQLTHAYDDERALGDFLQDLQVVTYEFENVPVATARWLEQHVAVYPPPAALQVAQDRLEEKTFFRRLDIPTPGFAAVETEHDLRQAAARLGLPAVLKTRRFGYDGKGQVVLREPADLEAAWRALGGQPLILEAFVPFERELSILAVRGKGGETGFYPLVENQHRDGILRLSRAPAPRRDVALQQQAEGYAARVMEALQYVGVLAIELFEVGDRLVTNEMAPRVHNSGHWTIEGAETSQFENHLRAILGAPLGSTTPRGHSAMLNLIGGATAWPVDRGSVLAIPGTHLHLYGKTSRPGRKLGHITIRADEAQTVEERLAQLLSVLNP
jgi:5-(carboxyamino)imidazole ribonucleotide synthase